MSENNRIGLTLLVLGFCLGLGVAELIYYKYF